MKTSLINPILKDLLMPIITPNLIIRPPQLGDGLALNQAIIDSYEIIRHTMPWAKTKPSLADTEQFVREAAANWILKKNEEPYLPLIIFNVKSKELIGMTGFHHIDWNVPCLETGYWINKPHAGRGYMTEAVNAITRYAFEVLHMNRVAITCDINNVRSRKIPERLGFTLEGTLRNNRINPETGLLSDTLVFAKSDVSNMPSLGISF